MELYMQDDIDNYLLTLDGWWAQQYKHRRLQPEEVELLAELRAEMQRA